MASSFISRLIDLVVQDPVILPWAGICYVIQAVVVLALKYGPRQGPWTNSAMTTGYHVNALLSMILQTYLGFVYWFGDETFKQSPNYDTLHLRDLPLHQGGRFLAQITLGGLLESIPVGVLGNPHADGALLMHLHHAGMLLVGCLGMGYFSMETVVGDNNSTTTVLYPIAGNFCPFFFGVIEASSIPLVIVDVFHPKKNPEWYQWHLEEAWVQQLNGASRILFAILYLVLRGIYFPYVVFGQVIPELWAQAQYADNAPFVTPLYAMMAFSILFTLLQLYWGRLIWHQVMKLFAKKGDNKNNTKTKSN